MNNRDWEQFGNDIFRTVQDAVESCNYDRLNQTISNTVNQVVDGVASGVRRASDSVRQRQAAYPVQYERKNPSKVGPVILTVTGCVWGAVSAISGIIFLLVGLFAGPIEGFGFTMVLDILLLALSVFMVTKGVSSIRRISRFKKYVKAIGYAEFCNISDLAISVGKDKNFVVKDVEKMIKKNWFCQGHLDNQKTCLIVTNQMYREYLQLEEKKTRLQKEEAQKAKERQQSEERERQQRAQLTPEVQKIIDQGDAFVKKIRECNDAIPGEEISAKIYHMEILVDKIFDRVEKHPETVSDIRRLMDYYLPTTIKLLEAYAQMDAQPIGGDNIQSAKKEIEATLDTLNGAFEKLLDTLFQDTAWDVSSDISVLNTMLAQEGLKEDGLKKS